MRVQSIKGGIYIKGLSGPSYLFENVELLFCSRNMMAICKNSTEPQGPFQSHYNRLRFNIWRMSSSYSMQFGRTMRNGISDKSVCGETFSSATTPCSCGTWGLLNSVPLSIGQSSCCSSGVHKFRSSNSTMSDRSWTLVLCDTIRQ